MSLHLALLFTASLGLIAGAVAQPRSAAPSFILITADDLGPQLGYYGEKTISTPNIDRLATENVRFDRAYVCQASCSPSRSAMYTGLYPHQSGQVGLDTPFAMRPGVLTLPAILKNAGYRTGVLGKVHVAPASAFAWDVDKSRGAYLYARRVKAMAEDARDFFASAPGPFFLKVSFFDPHHDNARDFPPVVEGLPQRPLTAADITVNTWTGEPITGTEGLRSKARTAGYYNCVSRLDTGVGMLLEELARAGRAEDTMVIFLSDNGGGPVSGGKMTINETGTRLPLIIRYPAAQRGAQVRRELVSAVDILPTVLETAGIPLPSQLARETIGRSLLPLIRGEIAPADWRKHLFTEFTFHVATLYNPCRAVRDERYKLVLKYPRLPNGIKIATTQDWESYVASHPQPVAEVRLYDLAEDRFERHDISGEPKHAEVRQRLERELRNWQRLTRDPLAP